MLATLRAASDEVEAVVASLDADALDGAVAADYVEVFAKLERLAAGGKMLSARRVVATKAWRHSDGAHRNPAGWMASVSGTTVGQATAVLESAAQLEQLPATEAAVRAGALSPTQVSLVAEAASVDPHAERELLERAGVDGIKGLRDRCAKVKAAARTDEVAHHQKIHSERSLRSFTDHDGAGRIEIRGPVDATASIMGALEPIERELFDLARSACDAERDRLDAIAFDALVALAERAVGACITEAAAPTRPTPRVTVRVDHSALRRGHTVPGEVCEIVGAGPVPVAVVSRMLDDAIIRAVVVDGTDVLSVSHLGRFIPARLRTAVTEQQRECVIAGCHADRHLEIDHNLPVEHGGPSALWNLNRLCHHHHRHKHDHDLRLAGEGTDMHFVAADEWTPPPGHDPP